MDNITNSVDTRLVPGCIKKQDGSWMVSDEICLKHMMETHLPENSVDGPREEMSTSISSAARFTIESDDRSIIISKYGEQ